MGKLGKYAFIAGLVIAGLAGFTSENPRVMWVLAALGVVVGFLNVTKEEAKTFLLAAIGLMLSATSVQIIPFIGGVVTRVMAILVVFMAPAVLVVAVKALLETAKD
jgi:hypothetical protein